MSNDLQKTLEEIYQGNSPINILKMIAKDTWYRIAFAQKTKGLKIYETTITQNILHAIMSAAQYSNFDIKLFEAKSEKANGNDIECFLQTKQGFLFLPMQSKIIYQKFDYPKLDHKVKNSKGGMINDQIDLLIKYAKNKQGFPIYLLYNYHDKNDSLQNIAPELFGISYLDAFHLKHKYQGKSTIQRGKNKGKKCWKIPKFLDLHPSPARPWHELLLNTSSNANNPNSLYNNGNALISDKFSIAEEYWNLKMYSREEIAEDDNWIDLTPTPSIGRLPLENSSTLDIDNNLNEKYNPKFRIMIGWEKPKTKIMLIM